MFVLLNNYQHVPIHTKLTKGVCMVTCILILKLSVTYKLHSHNDCKNIFVNTIVITIPFMYHVKLYYVIYILQCVKFD